MKTSILGGALGQIVPRSRGFSAPVTQSADVADVADAAQLPRLSSARANNSASLGSFPAVSRISRLRIQPIAARRAGNASPWHDQRNLQIGLVEPLDKAKAGFCVVGAACEAQQRHRAEFTVDDPSRLQVAPALVVQTGGYFGDGGF